MSPIRLALLLCDTLSPAVKAVQGDYYDLYGRLLKSSFPPTAKESVLVDPFDVVHAQEYPDKDADYAAVILSGSGPSNILGLYSIIPPNAPLHDQWPLRIRICPGSTSLWRTSPT
jgi:hypothetical protein